MTIKAYCSNLTVRFGTVSITGALYPIKNTSRKPEYKLYTPDKQPTEQVYRSLDGEVWYKQNLVRGIKNEDGEIELINQHEVAEAKESSLPLNTLTLTAHPKDDVDEFVFPSENQAYIFKPLIKKGKKIIADPVNDQWYDFLNALVRENHISFLGMCNLQHHEGLFRLGMYQGWITVQKQLYPEELHQHGTYVPSITGDERKKAVQVTNKAIKRFNHNDYMDTITQRLLELQPSTEIEAALPISAVPDKIDLMSALDMFEVV